MAEWWARGLARTTAKGNPYGTPELTEEQKRNLLIDQNKAARACLRSDYADLLDLGILP